MRDEIPEGYEIPSLSFLAKEPLWFGIPNKQAAGSVMFSGAVFLAALKLIGILYAIPIYVGINALVLVVLRFVFDKDPHWFEHLTSHHYPLTRWTGG